MGGKLNWLHKWGCVAWHPSPNICMPQHKSTMHGNTLDIEIAIISAHEHILKARGGGHLEDVKAPAVTLQQVLWNLMCHALYIYMSACIHPFIFLSMSFVNSMLLKIASSFAVYMRYPQIVFANPFAYSGHRVDIDSLSRATYKSILPTPHPGHSQPHTGPTCCNLIVEPLCNSWGVMTPRDPSTL